MASSNGSSAIGNGASNIAFAQNDQGKTITKDGFRITTHKLPILKAGPIDQMNAKLGITVPEMIFGDNCVSIDHEGSGWSINFNAFDALDRVDKKGDSMLKVAYSKEWQKTREHVHEDIKEIIKPFDWSYSTDYKGTAFATPPFSSTEKSIPIQLLTRPDPILFFDELVLYEDELADNGIAMLSCKIRVMPARLLLLSRFFLRLDGVLFRIRDTRIFVEFQTGEVIREYTAREQKYDVIREQLAYLKDEATAQMRDPNKLSELMPVVERTLEALTLT